MMSGWAALINLPPLQLLLDMTRLILRGQFLTGQRSPVGTLSVPRWPWNILVVGRLVHRATIIVVMVKLPLWNKLIRCSILLLQATLRLL